MLEKGKYYRWFGGGVVLVERVSASSARVKIITGKVNVRDFQTAHGKDVHFESVETKWTNISPTSILEPATDEEVRRYVKDRAKRGGKR